MTALLGPATIVTLVGVIAGGFGLIIGSYLNVVAYRVPAGISLLRESRCPSCDQPVRWYENVPVLSWLLLRGRCGSCRSAIGARYPLVELATGASFAAVALVWLLATGRPGSGIPLPAAPSLDSVGAAFAAITAADGLAGPTLAQALVLAAFLWFAAAGIVLTLIDLDTRRLPHAITTPGILVTIALLVGAVLLGADAWALVRAGIGFVALYLFYGLLRLIRPDGMGGGDVRLAAYAGLLLGWLGWGPLVVGAFAAFVLGGVYGVALLFSRRAGRRTAIPFGPWIILGAWVGIVAGDAIAGGYLTLLDGRLMS